jgi:uncharacterized protein (DUF342 family)
MADDEVARKLDELDRRISKIERWIEQLEKGLADLKTTAERTKRPIIDDDNE